MFTSKLEAKKDTDLPDDVKDADIQMTGGKNPDLDSCRLSAMRPAKSLF